VGSVWASRRVKERGQSAYCLEAAAAVDGPELSEAPAEPLFELYITDMGDRSSSPGRSGTTLAAHIRPSSSRHSNTRP